MPIYLHRNTSYPAGGISRLIFEIELLWMIDYGYKRVEI